MRRFAIPMMIGYPLAFGGFVEALTGDGDPKLLIAGVSLMAFGVAQFVLEIRRVDRDFKSAQRRIAYQGAENTIYEPLYVIGEIEPFAQFPHPQQCHAADDWEDWERA